MFDGDDAAAHAAYEQAARIAERAGDPDLAVLSCLGRGTVLAMEALTPSGERARLEPTLGLGG
jgi:hypothetical protein